MTFFKGTAGLIDPFNTPRRKPISLENAGNSGLPAGTLIARVERLAFGAFRANDQRHVFIRNAHQGATRLAQALAARVKPHVVCWAAE
jgi:hypothetical protein